MEPADAHIHKMVALVRFDLGLAKLQCVSRLPKRINSNKETDDACNRCGLWMGNENLRVANRTEQEGTDSACSCLVINGSLATTRNQYL